jgi:glycosyltransferase involved in cell wall biosynthesis
MAASRRRQRVLFLTHHLPWPPSSGGRLREAQILQRLARCFDIDLVAISKPAEDDTFTIGEALARGVRAQVFEAHLSARPDLSPQVRQHDSDEARVYLESWWLRHRDATIHVEGHYLFNLLPLQARPRALVVEHNIESTLLDQQANLAGDPWDRRRLLRAAAITRQTERAVWETAAAVGAITARDAGAIRKEVPAATVHLLPNGADHLHGTRSPASVGDIAASELLFVGNFAYLPSQDAARWLLTTIFPVVALTRPATTLTFVGSAPPSWLHQAACHNLRIRVTGHVPDLAPWLDAADVVVCPLRVGGGIKVKVLEALNRGRAVVTTPVGSQGLEALPVDAIIVRQDASSLADACLLLLASPQMRRHQQDRALQAARLLPTWDLAADALAAAWELLADGGKASALTAAQG